MIQITMIGDLAFEIRFDEKLRRDLQDIAGSRSVETALESVLSDLLLGYEPFSPFYDELSDEVPF